MATTLLLCLLLPLALIGQSWLSGALPPRFRQSSLLRYLLEYPKQNLAALLALGLVVLTMATTYGGARDEYQFLFDDSFISFRYAQNLAAGHGLRWNPGEVPSEGYTNLLLVLLVAPVIKMGGDPLLASRILSGVGIAVMLFVLVTMARRAHGASISVALVAALSLLTSGLTIEVAMLGLETVPFAAALLVALVLSERFFDTERDGWMLASGGVAFLALLLRPEIVFLLAIIPVAALLVEPTRWRLALRAALLLGVSFGIPCLLYQGFKLWYFGSLLPNPAFVKAVGGGWREQGIASVRGFLSNHSKLVVICAISVLLGRSRIRTAVTCGLTAVAFLVFFCRVDTLMDAHNRFLYPAFPLLIVIALPALVALTQRICDWQQPPVVTLLFGGTLLATVLYINLGFALHRVQLRSDDVTSREVHQASLVLRRIGISLSHYPKIADVTIGSGDAGLVPYESGARHVDMAGLTTRYIATHRDPLVSATYFFDQHPDLIIMRARIGGGLVDYDHGVLGDYTAWNHHAGWNDYRDVGGIHNGPRHDLHFFLRKNGPNEAALGRIIRKDLAQADVAPLVAAMGTAPAPDGI